METKKKDTPREGYDKNGKFAQGNTLGTGRGVGGRRKTLDTLDKLMAKAGNQEKYMDACQKAFDKDPLGFVHKYVVPVMPLFAKDPKFEEKMAYTDEEILQRIDAVINGARKRINKQAAEDNSQMESSSIEQSTN